MSQIDEQNLFLFLALWHHHNLPDALQDLERFLALHPENVRHQDTNLTTMLHKAVVLNSQELIRLLLSYNADLNHKDEYGITPLYQSVRSSAGSYHGALEIVKLLLEAGADPNIQCSGGFSSLFFPAFHHDDKNLELAKLLLSYGADPFVLDIEGNTLLHRCYHPEILKLLLSLGLDVNRRNQRGYTPIMCTALDASSGIVRILLSNGADINLRDETGKTPLHLFVLDDERTDAAGVRRLIQAGANIETQDNEGRTPLHIAVGSHFIHGVKMLLRHGAKVNTRDHQGKTPLDLLLTGEYLGRNYHYVPPPHGDGDADLFSANIKKLTQLLRRNE